MSNRREIPIAARSIDAHGSLGTVAGVADVHGDRGEAMTKNPRRADRGPRGDRPGGQSDLDTEVRSAFGHRGRRDDRLLEVRVEFVLLDGDAGKALARRQAAVMRKVLR
jgi:hypothetical protein